MKTYENDKLVIPEVYKKMTIPQLQAEEKKLLEAAKQKRVINPKKPNKVGKLVINF